MISNTLNGFQHCLVNLASLSPRTSFQMIGYVHRIHRTHVSPISKKISSSYSWLRIHRSVIAPDKKPLPVPSFADIEIHSNLGTSANSLIYTVSSQTTVYNLFDTQADPSLISFNVLPRHNTSLLHCSVYDKSPYFVMRFGRPIPFLKSKLALPRYRRSGASLFLLLGCSR